MSDLSKRIASLSPQQRAVFEQRLKQQGLSPLKVQTIPRRPPSAPLRLSFAQQRLWVLDQLEPGNPFYNDTRAVRLNGALDVLALAQSLNAVVRRHEALRTAFVLVEDEPRQLIAPSLVLGLPVVDMQRLPAPRWEAAVGRVATDRNQQPFDLSRMPLLRTTLVRLNAQAHVLLVTLHHIVSDGWSTDVLIQEVATLYEAFATGRASPLPEPPIQYADFALWQRQVLQGPLLEEHLAYWRERLAGAPPLLELPTDQPRPAVKSFRGATHTFALPAPLYAALAALSQRENVSLFMTLLAAFDVVLYRHTQQPDIVVGTPVANRTRAETAGLIGFFANMLVLRADLSGNPGFRALLGQVRTVTLGAYAHQELPFEQLVEQFQSTRDLSYTPLFQVMFSLQKVLVPKLERAGVTTQPFALPSTTAKFDLSLFIWEGADQLTGQVEYSTDLFDAATIRRLAGHVQTLLAGIVADPDLRLGDLPLLTPAEREQLLVEWSATQSGVRSQESGVRKSETGGWSLHELFEEQVERTRDAVAVVFEPGVRDQGSGGRGQGDKACPEWERRETRRQGDREQGASDSQSPIPARPLRYACPSSSVLSPQSSVLSPQSSLLTPLPISAKFA